ncbi:hypothetical protein ESZ50_10210 [Weissella muntiaci]|uniref:Uncharacterized protein n=1 Tax=Weissella muntiaci TaxID=2508881 RepID=A0A6C2C224_9LACO|nr:hypothetical protein [Weissella muntiaci]TYC47994.1 hypothetical protein ESZ50_10210 [Weissella muntiaci]
MIQFYLRYNVAKHAPVGVFNSKGSQQDCVDIPVAVEEIAEATKFIFINIHYSDNQIEITSLLPVDDLKDRVFMVKTNAINSLESYAAVALEELIEQLNHGTATTHDGVQPTTEYMYIGEHYQWSVIPW